MPDAITTLLSATGGAFLGKFVGPLAEHYGKVALERWQQLGTRAQQLLTDAGGEPVPVTPKVLLPLLEAAALEDDDFLQKKWANLLANAATPHRKVPVEPSFVEILKQVTPVQVRILSALLKEAGPTISPQNHDFTYMAETRGIQRSLLADGVSVEEFDIALDNLIRLRLCTASGMAPLKSVLNTANNPALMMAAALGQGTANAGLTKLGAAFLDACSPPTGPPLPTT